MIGSATMAASLLLYFAIFFAAAFFWPTWRLWRRDGVNALVVPFDDSAYGLVGRWFRLLLISIFVLLGAAVAGVPMSWTGPLAWAESAIPSSIGWALLAASLPWIVAAQARMGRSWRIGIDKSSVPPLVRSGPFGLSRNPIFLGMRASLLGLLLVLPNAFTLAILLVGEVLMQVQVRLEEEHLSTVHGRDYEDYRRSVRRWI